MAEELAAAEAEPEVIAPPEVESGSEAQPDAIETLASEMGWVPEGEYRGDREWKPAAEFIKAGHDITRTVSKQLRSVQDELRRVTSASSQILADELAKKDAHWQGVHRQAVEDGNVPLAERASEERSKLKQQAPADNAEPPETQDFRKRHSAWFGVDRVATMRAMEVAERSRQLGASPTEQLEDAERVIRQEYPKLFPVAAKRPAGVQTAAARNANNSSGKKGFADMPQASQDMAREYLSRHGVPLEKFAESYFADPANHERKVG